MQCPPGAANDAHIALLLGVERRTFEDFGHPQNPVERRADFVAHVREKLRLGAARGLGKPFGFQQFAVARHQATGQGFKNVHHDLHLIPRRRGDLAAGEFQRQFFRLPAQRVQGLQCPTQHHHRQQAAAHENDQDNHGGALLALVQPLVSRRTVQYRHHHVGTVDDRQRQIAGGLVSLTGLAKNRDLLGQCLLDQGGVKAARPGRRCGQPFPGP
ncbi:MAG: hypothetical protein AW09_001863 [Candidatus Accumulibacter phosphatis]|uniref:Uncharacterized protein n=1 Tax=Candidatus Accumulibacter phosphatis TaxID=327160 RepID=A0A080M719_9PROT|nr:MAG: hypothetical protein AW09_001863 [Candidatus Accumulibacter phosphatis]